MRLGFSLLLALLPNLSYGAVYHFANCQLQKGANGWAVAAAMGGAREVLFNHRVGLGSVVDKTGGSCDVAIGGPGDGSALIVSQFVATGTNVTVTPVCDFKGQGLTVHSTDSILKEGESKAVDYTLSTGAFRNVIYFASAAEAAQPGWFNARCDALAKAQTLLAAAESHTTCALPSDQGTGSLHGNWMKLPVALVFDREFYTANRGRDADALKRAVDTWNRWAHLRGKIAFVIARDGVGAGIPALSDCSQSSYTAAVHNVVGVWKITGDAGAHANARASCGGTGGKLLASTVQGQTDWDTIRGRIRAASVLLNFDDFNSPGKPAADLESVFLHQLGHVLGLLNSCNGGTDATSAPMCFTGGVLTAPRLYTDAVMFPFVSASEVRRDLGQNDYDRVNCLY
jgi:hypothetical protein